MSRKCRLTGAKPLSGNKVSHANNKTKTRKNVNLQSKRVFVAAKQKWVTLRLSTRAFRTLDKYGWNLEAAAKRFKELRQWI
jgi:large subunit ribosomal protein L28